ncbi:MAG: DUF692 family multinuclear iron-containing protein [Deltaproteobacteria bacterium]
MLSGVDTRLPDVPGRLGLGVGMDLLWQSGRIGFLRSAEADRVSAPVKAFIERYGTELSHLFIAYQPRTRGKLHAADYFEAYDDIFDAASAIGTRAFHHTLLNLGALTAYDRAPIFEFTNALIDRYGFSWVVEDLGIWSLDGKSLPYPLPPLLTLDGLRAAVDATRECQQSLACPLVVEFPGFTEGASFYLGEMDAFDFFRRVVEETGSPATIDTGHVLSYQWIRGRQTDFLRGLERLPLEQCFEVHLSGSQISKGKFRDTHHGVLLDEQLDVLEYLLENCPNLRAVTYEDPKFDDNGVLIAKSLPNFVRLRQMVEAWRLRSC